MNTEKEINTRRVAELLNRSAHQLDDTTLSALSEARRVALERQQTKKTWLVLSTGQHSSASWLPHTPAQWAITAALLIAAIISIAPSSQKEPEYDKSRIDIAILIDDMPLEAFVDDTKHI